MTKTGSTVKVLRMAFVGNKNCQYHENSPFCIGVSSIPFVLEKTTPNSPGFTRYCVQPKKKTKAEKMINIKSEIRNFLIL